MATPSPSATGLPPGYHAPLAAVDANNHGAWVVICNAFGLLVILITLLIRYYIRTKVSPPIDRDDWTLTAATVLAVIQAGVVFAQVHDGFGRSSNLVDNAHLVKIQQLDYAAVLFYIAALYASKCSVVLLFKRISSDRMHSLVAWIILGICSGLGVVSILILGVRCGTSHPWLRYGRSRSCLVAEWDAILAFDVVTEAALFAMSLHLVWNLQTSLSRKARVVMAFGLRLPVIAIAVIRLVYINLASRSSDQNLAEAIPAILTQIEMFYAIMSATIPCLRPFLAGFITNYGAMGGETVIGGSQVGNSSKNRDKRTKGSFAMTSVSATVNGKSRSGHEHSMLQSRDDVDGPTFRPDRAVNDTRVTHGSRKGHDASSIGSDESTKMIIRKEVQWQVDTEGSRTNSQLGVYDLGGAGSAR